MMQLAAECGAASAGVKQMFLCVVLGDVDALQADESAKAAAETALEAATTRSRPSEASGSVCAANGLLVDMEMCLGQMLHAPCMVCPLVFCASCKRASA